MYGQLIGAAAGAAGGGGGGNGGTDASSLGVTNTAQTGAVTVGGLSFPSKSNFPGGNAGAVVAGIAAAALLLLAVNKGGGR